MNCAESLAIWRERNQEMTTRVRRLTSNLDAEALNRHPEPSIWSPAQVVEHMVLTNRLYLRLIETALQNAERAAIDHPIHFSFFGKILSKAAGPGGNAPAPKELHPRTAVISTAILEEWEQQQTQLLSLMDQAAGVNLARIRVQNPLLRIIPMNLADCFEILTVHTERHVKQIQERLFANTSDIPRI